MRIMVFFDLPVQTKKQRYMATKFRSELIKDGFYMIQFSLYGRICNTLESAQAHEEKIAHIVPDEGSVRSMIVTEKQYASMLILSGNYQKREKKKVDKNQLSFF